MGCRVGAGEEILVDSLAGWGRYSLETTMFPREICHLATNVSLASQRIAANSDFPRNLIYDSREIIFPYDSSRFPRDKKTTLGKQVNSSSVTTLGLMNLWS